MRTRERILIALTLAIGACSVPGSDGIGPPPDTELTAYCTVAGTPGLESWVGDVATVCTAGDDGETATCAVSRVSSDGVLTPIDLPADLQVVRALPAAGGRLVLLTADQRLVLAHADGTVEREIASWAADPWVSEDGQRVAWIGLPDGPTEPDLGMLTVVAVESLSDTDRTIVAEDDLASSPRPMPGTGNMDVLYVSGQSGVTAFWVAGPEHPATQLTNVGLDDVDEDWTPVAEAQLGWAADGALFFSARGDGTGDYGDDSVVDETEEDVLWRLDPVEGVVTEVGPGAWPRVQQDGNVFALLPPGDPCGSVYTPGGTP